MPEHYTRATESATRHCNRCGRPTQHAVSAGRIGRCLECGPPPGQLSKKQQCDRQRREREARNPKLF